MACLFVVSAPSGAGKTTIVNSVLNRYPDIILPISCSTRAKRDKEINHKHYEFISKSEFESRIKENYFLEYANVFGNFYGTAKETVDKNLQDNNDILLELDWQGALQIKKHYPEAILIYILPPSIDQLKKRLISRNADSMDTINYRIQQAQGDILKYKFYDYVVVNINFNEACSSISSIIEASRLSLIYKSRCLQKLLQNINFDE